MKKCWPLLAVIFLLGGCAPERSVKPEVQREEKVELPDPSVEVEGTWAFAEVGADIEAPVGAENARYFIISDKIAEIQFTRNGVLYSYRASQLEENLMEIQGEAQQIEGIQAIVGSCEIPLQEADGRLLAVWKWGGISYGLATDEQVDGGIIKSLAEELARETMPSQI